MMEVACVGCTVWWRCGVVRQRWSSEIDYSLVEVQDSDGTFVMERQHTVSPRASLRCDECRRSLGLTL